MHFLRWIKHNFQAACNGVVFFYRQEPHAGIHSLIALLVIVAGFYFNISATEWLFVILAIFMVITTEIINTSIEWIADFIQPNYDSRIKVIKDLAAGAVLIASFAATVIGLIIFLPNIMEMI